MGCEYCGGALDPESKICPYCGQINRQAQKYAQEMDRYREDFENSKQDVYTAVRRYSDVTMRVILLAVLTVAFLVMLLVYTKAYRIYDRVGDAMNWLQRDKHKAVMNEYLENEDFLQFAAYCQKQGISGYEDGFREYRYIEYPASVYAGIYLELMRQVFPSEYEAEKPRKIEFLGDELDFFYKAVSETGYYDLTEEEIAWTRKIQQDMLSQLEALLVTYCRLTPEEAADLRDLSESKRVILIEERMSHAE